MFDNGLLIKMCEDYRKATFDPTNQEILEWESSFDSRVQQYILDKKNAMQLGRLGAIPALTARVPLNEMKFYLQRGFPKNV